MSPRDAWNTTLREYVTFMTYNDKQAIESEVDDVTKQDILDHFALMEIQNG